MTKSEFLEKISLINYIKNEYIINYFIKNEINYYLFTSKYVSRFSWFL